MSKVRIKQVRLYGHVDDKLVELASKRIKEGGLIITKTQIVAELIIRAHKRECK